MNIEEILSKLDGVKKQGDGWIAKCPAHDDKEPSLSITTKGDKVLLHCFAGCSQEDVLKAVGLETGPGLTLEEYARAKRLPVDFLESNRVTERKFYGKPAVRIAYYDDMGREAKPRYRVSMTGKARFFWAKGAKAIAYGLWRLKVAKEAGYIVVVEGESDCHTLWYHDVPALGIPGASLWRSEYADYLEGLRVYVWQEPDKGGKQFVADVCASLSDALVIQPDKYKDVSDYHVAGEDVAAVLSLLMEAATPYKEIRFKAQQKRAQEAETKAKALLNCPNILEEFGGLCRELNLVGEEKSAKLLYLAITSRVLDRPISVIVKGPSSAGKSYLVDVVLQTFPQEAYYSLSSMSEKALIYSDESFVNRILVIYEAAGIENEFTIYILRSLLSEGRIEYLTVEKTSNGLEPKEIIKPGPTGAIVTTTRTRIEREMETRMFEVTVSDTREQTKGVLHSLAQQANLNMEGPDLTTWHELQRWISLAGERQVVIPYANALADLSLPTAVRLRRDFNAILHLIKTHAILHQKQRKVVSGHIIADLKDYRAIYDLVSDLVNEGAKVKVNQTIREVVDAVYLLHDPQDPDDGHVTVKQVANELDLDTTAARRRIHVALSEGYIINQETRKYQPFRLVPGEDLPEDEEVLPTPEQLEERLKGDF